MKHLRFCDERGRLLDLVQGSAKNYALAANHVASGTEIMPVAEYTRVRAEIERARLNAEQAREEYLRHRREHGC